MIICTLIAITKYFLDLFAKERRVGGGGSDGRITRLVNSTRPLMQKLAMYVIVVALHLSDFCCNLSLMAVDLKCTPKYLADIARELGCSIEKVPGNNISLARLSAPLNFPKRRLIAARK